MGLKCAEPICPEMPGRSSHLQGCYRFCGARINCRPEVEREAAGLGGREDAAVEDGLEGEIRFWNGAAEALDAFGGVCADVGVGGHGVQGHGVEVQGAYGGRVNV